MEKVSSYRPTFWLLSGLSLGSTLLISAIFSPWQPILLWQEVLASIQGWGAAGVVAFMMLYNLATIFLIPGSLLTLAGGILYGFFWGSVYVILAATLGATIAFLIGRYFAHDWVCRRLRKYPKFRSIDAAVAKHGARVVLLTRLSPVFPFNLLNYAFGVTKIPLRDYILGSMGMVPGTVLYVYIGALLGDVTALGASPELGPQVQALQWSLRGIGLIATAGVTLFITRIAKKALNEEIRSSS